MHRMLTVALIVALFAAGCSSGSIEPQLPGVGAYPNNSDIAEYHQNRLDTVAPGSGAVLQGKVDVTGFKLATTPGTGTGTGKLWKIMAHLIDDEYDILSAQVGKDGSFYLPYAGEKTELKLKITIDTTEDLNADSKANDQIVQTVPVKLLPGYVANIQMAVLRGSQSIMDKALWPSRGAVVVNDIMRLDGNGRDTTFYGTFLADGCDVFSVDGDKFLGLKDLRLPDLDRNGWPDRNEQLYADPGLTGANVEGTVISVSVVNRTLRLRTANKSELVVYLQPFTGMEAISADGYFDSAKLSLDTKLVKRWVVATGRMAPEGLLAEWLVIAPAKK
jgi:hypothetical protein